MRKWEEKRMRREEEIQRRAEKAVKLAEEKRRQREEEKARLREVRLGETKVRGVWGVWKMKWRWNDMKVDRNLVEVGCLDNFVCLDPCGEWNESGMRGIYTAPLMQ